MRAKTAGVAIAYLAMPVLAQAEEKLDRAGISAGTLGNLFFKPLIQGAAGGLKDEQSECRCHFPWPSGTR